MIQREQLYVQPCLGEYREQGLLRGQGGRIQGLVRVQPAGDGDAVVEAVTAVRIDASLLGVTQQGSKAFQPLYELILPHHAPQQLLL